MCGARQRGSCDGDDEIHLGDVYHVDVVISPVDDVVLAMMRLMMVVLLSLM